MIFLISFGAFKNDGVLRCVRYESNFIDELGTVVMYKNEFQFNQFLAF